MAAAVLADKQRHRESTELAAALAVFALAEEQTCHVAVEHAAAKTAAAVEMAIDLAVEKMWAELGASHTEFLAALASAVAKAIALAASGHWRRLAMKRRHVLRCRQEGLLLTSFVAGS